MLSGSQSRPQSLSHHQGLDDGLMMAYQVLSFKKERHGSVEWFFLKPDW